LPVSKDRSRLIGSLVHHAHAPSDLPVSTLKCPSAYILLSCGSATVLISTRTLVSHRRRNHTCYRLIPALRNPTSFPHHLFVSFQPDHFSKVFLCYPYDLHNCLILYLPGFHFFSGTPSFVFFWPDSLYMYFQSSMYTSSTSALHSLQFPLLSIPSTFHPFLSSRHL